MVFGGEVSGQSWVQISAPSFYIYNEEHEVYKYSWKQREKPAITLLYEYATSVRCLAIRISFPKPPPNQLRLKCRSVSLAFKGWEILHHLKTQPSQLQPSPQHNY